jgi:hypothetical protein
MNSFALRKFDNMTCSNTNPLGCISVRQVVTSKIDQMTNLCVSNFDVEYGLI